MWEFYGFIIFSMILIIALIVMSKIEVTQKKKQHRELLAAKDHLVDTYSKLIVALNNSKIDLDEFNSMKRRISALLDALDQHSALIEQHTEQFKAVASPSFIITDGLDVDIEEVKNDISDIFSIPEDATVEPIQTIKSSTLETLREHVESQGLPGNWDRNEYMRGAYNGMELMLATLENRKPVFKGKHDYGKDEANNEQ